MRELRYDKSWDRWAHSDNTSSHVRHGIIVLG